ncbi:MAG: hypothetical protein KGJ07_07525 [Patescibacteria group bacterium]|nr:hypothetical protein [Patescibacteria group bacterium]
MSTTRYYTFQKALMDSIIADGATEADWYNNSLTIQIPNWDSLTALQQTAVATAMTTAGFQFDHDETV